MFYRYQYLTEQINIFVCQRTDYMWVYRVCGRTVAMGNTYFQRDHRENGGINAYGEAVVVLLMPFMVTFSNCSDISWLPDFMGDRWPWSYGSWIYNYLRNQCLSPLRCEFEPGSGEVYSIQHYVQVQRFLDTYPWAVVLLLRSQVQRFLDTYPCLDCYYCPPLLICVISVYHHYVVSSNPAQARCTLYSIMW
jgi:hypothetical protein